MEKSEDRTYTGQVTRPSAEGADPRDFLRLLWRRKWILLPVIVLIPLATYVLANRAEKKYQASAVIQLQATATDQGTGNLNSGPADQQTNDRVAALIGTSGVADEAAHLLHLPKGSLRGAAHASANENTGFITIVVTQRSARGAAKVANAFAEAVRTTRASQGRTQVNATIAGIKTQLKQLPAASPERLQLTQQLQQQQTLLQAQSQNAQMIQGAVPPASPSSPHPKRAALIALIGALALGAALVALLDRMDRRLRDPEEIEALVGAPLLVSLPESAFPGSAPVPGIAVAFQMLRDSLTYFNVDEELDSVMVVSSLKGEGKTTVASNLAVSFARSGKRVVVVCCDLRNPQLGARFGMDRREGGLSTLLRDGGSAVDALQEVEGFDGNLRVLPGGPVPPNPSELLGSARMAAVLEELKQASDLVVIDTPPLLLVSDAFALLPRVSGAVGITRLDSTPRHAVRRMADVVRTAGGRMLGMVATGLRPTLAGHGSGYGYGYGYGQEPEVPEKVPPAAAAATRDSAPPTNGHVPVEPPAARPETRSRLAQVFRSSSSS
jgi:non-specific protein-tyrosine kinase